MSCLIVENYLVFRVLWVGQESWSHKSLRGFFARQGIFCALWLKEIKNHWNYHIFPDQGQLRDKIRDEMWLAKNVLCSGTPI